MRRERLYLGDILSAADAMAGFIQGQDVERFRANLQLRSAAGRQLTIIGEAGAHLSPELRASHPEIPWLDTREFRNIIVHNCLGIDWEEVWRSATEDAPLLRSQIAGMLQDEFAE